MGCACAGGGQKGEMWSVIRSFCGLVYGANVNIIF